MEKSLNHENNFEDKECFCLVCFGTFFFIFSKRNPEETWVQLNVTLELMSPA